ncbi:major facilitator superfamily domain-containing protein [Aspergillus heterothallicus]
MSGWRFALSLSDAQVKAAQPPGTSKLIAHHHGGEDRLDDELLLIPRPTKRAEDPLNWPMWRKCGALFALCFYVLVAEYASAVPASVLPAMAYSTQPPTPFAKLTPIMAYNALMIGVSNLFWVPLANAFGRRIILIISSLIMTMAGVWAAKASSLESLFGARAVQGIGMGPCFTLPATIIGEIFFLHQSGRAMAFYVTALAAGPLFGGITGGYIASGIDVTAVWWISTGLSAGTFCIVLLLVPESMFNRPAYTPAVNSSSGNDVHGSNDKEPSAEMIENYIPMAQSHPMPLTFWLALRRTTYQPGFLRELIRPIYTVRLPGVWVPTLQAAALVAGIITMSTVAPQLLALPPYSWHADVGLFNLGGVVALVLALLTNYLVLDYMAKRQANVNSDGFVESESRLALCAPGLFLATTGLLTFGLCAANPGGSAWVGLVVGNGMLTFGLVTVPGITYTYITDSYRSRSGDCFVIVGLVRAVIACVWTFYVGNWIESAGPALTFGIFAIVLGVFSLLTIPLYFYGKRLRIATAKYLDQESH